MEQFAQTGDDGVRVPAPVPHSGPPLVGAPARLLQLQRTAGNRAVGRMLARRHGADEPATPLQASNAADALEVTGSAKAVRARSFLRSSASGPATELGEATRVADMTGNELGSHIGRTGQRSISPLPVTVHRAFARIVQRSYEDPGDNVEWVAGRAPQATVQDIRDYWQQTFKTFLLVYLNGRPFGKFLSTADGKHAEENFMDAWRAHWKRAAAKGYLLQDHINQVEFIINNSPCAEKCSRLLPAFVGGWNMAEGRDLRCPIRLYIRAQNVYGNDPRAWTAVENLSHPDITLEAYNPQFESQVEGLAGFARLPAYATAQQRRQERAEAWFGGE